MVRVTSPGEERHRGDVGGGGPNEFNHRANAASVNVSIRSAFRVAPEIRWTVFTPSSRRSAPPLVWGPCRDPLP